MADWMNITVKRRMVEFTTLESTDIWIRSDIVIAVEADNEEGTSMITLDGGDIVYVQDSALEVLTALGYGD